MKRAFTRAIGAVSVFLVLALATRAGDDVQVRGGLANCLSVLAEAQTAPPGLAGRIVYLGGAFTWGQGASRDALSYRALTTAAVRKMAPQMRLVDFDHSLAGGGSWLAAFRTPTDVVQHYLPLCLAVIELAADDAAEDPVRGQAALEGLVRQVRRAHPQADMLFIYACPADSAAIVWHEEIASVLVCDQAGPVATLRFHASTVGWFGSVGPDSGDLECSIDDGPWQLKTVFQAGRESLVPQAGLLAEGLDPAAEHVLRLRVAERTLAGSTGRAARIGYFLVNGTVDDRYKGLTPLARIDAVYKAMEPLQYTPPAGRWQFIPKTMERLRDGGTLRIVMLGDSIVNDTGSSQYELLLERVYPRCKVEKIRSVRGSTGCWWYKEENRVEEWVLKHAPDLLMIGGISQRDDTESIRAVIHQVRAAQPQVEVMLLSPVFGSYDPRADKEWTYDADPNGDSYRSRLARLAAEEKAEFVNMTGPWGEYIRHSERARGWFMRDPVHANERGFQILGRILEKYFAPQ